MAVPMKKPRFDLHTMGTRISTLHSISREISWWSDHNEEVLGTVFIDLIDNDFGWALLVRDETGKFRAVEIGASYDSVKKAEANLRIKIEELVRSPSFNGTVAQGEPIPALDLLTPIGAENELHPYFLELIQRPGKAPARKVIHEIGIWLYPADNHFVREFQRHQFDQRLWEIYLWAAFREIGFDVAQHEAPDFECLAPGINFTVEATTISPSQKGVLAHHPNPKTNEEVKDFLNTYMPIKFGSALVSKLEKKNAQLKAYWEREHSKNKPFILAVADFHKPANHEEHELGSMVYSQSALYIYLYGHRIEWTLKNGTLFITTAPVKEHNFKEKNIPSGFFDLPEAENISAVLFSNAGTIAKFDRMGVVAGFGAANHKYFRFGFTFDPDPNAVVGKYFYTDVESNDYQEYWSDELQMFHNPNAKHPMPPEWFPGIAHHFFENGQLHSIDCEGRVLSSATWVLHIRENTEDNN